MCFAVYLALSFSLRRLYRGRSLSTGHFPDLGRRMRGVGEFAFSRRRAQFFRVGRDHLPQSTGPDPEEACRFYARAFIAGRVAAFGSSSDRALPPSNCSHPHGRRDSKCLSVLRWSIRTVSNLSCRSRTWHPNGMPRKGTRNRETAM